MTELVGSSDGGAPSPRDGGFVVATLTSYGGTVNAASALASTGRLARYHVPIAVSKARARQIERVLPGVVSRPILREVRRRPPPDGVRDDQVVPSAAAADLMRVLSERLGLSHERRVQLIHRQRAAFDRAVARKLDKRDGALWAVHGSVHQSVARARDLGVTTVLDSAVSHYGWLRDLMREEEDLVPAYAATLQGHDLSDEVIAAHDRELENADVVLALSSQARDTLLQRGVPSEKVAMTPLGVDTELFQPSSRVDDGCFRILFIGQITQRKGISYLVEAFRKAAIPHSELVFVGIPSGPPDPWISVPGVRHHAPVPRAELPAIHATADVLVLPSLSEGFPLVAIEAMASGLPVILSENTSGPDVLRDGHDGFVVPIRDADAIAERLRLLHADPDRRRAIGVAARRTAERYPWSAYRDRINEIADAVVAGRRPPPDDPRYAHTAAGGDVNAAAPPQ